MEKLLFLWLKHRRERENEWKNGRALMPLKSFLRIHRIDNDPCSMIYCLLVCCRCEHFQPPPFFACHLRSSIFTHTHHQILHTLSYIANMICVAGALSWKFPSKSSLPYERAAFKLLMALCVFLIFIIIERSTQWTPLSPLDTFILHRRIGISLIMSSSWTTIR